MKREEIKDRVFLLLQTDILLRSLPERDEHEVLGEGGIGLDSLSFLRFLTILEKEFHVQIEDDLWEYSYFNTPSKIIDYILSRVRE